MKSSLLTVVKKECTVPFALTVVIGTLFYVFLQLYLMNISLINQTISGNFPISYKTALLSSLFATPWDIFPLKEFLYIVLTGILVSINISLLVTVYRKLKQTGKTKFHIGGSSLLAVSGIGCVGCGISVLSFLGPSSGLAAVFLHNSLLQAVITGVLLFSIFLSIKKLQTEAACRISVRAQEMSQKAR